MNQLKSSPATPSTFRLMRALCRTMRKTEWEFRTSLYKHEFRPKQYIRQKGEEDSCPLTFTWHVASGQFYNSRDWEPAAYKLGFPAYLAEDIIGAADEVMFSERDRQLRRILLRAAGLKEP